MAEVEPRQIGVDKKFYLKSERDAHILKVENTKNDIDSCLSISPGMDSERGVESDAESLVADPSTDVESVEDEQAPFASVRVTFCH